MTHPGQRRRKAAALRSALLALDNALLLSVMHFLAARELGRLQCVSTRFSSVVAEAARLAVAAASATVQARAPRRGREPWLCVMHELELLAAPLTFATWGPRVKISEDASLASRSGVTCHGGHRAALCSLAPMRAGRHFVEMTVESGTSAHFGVVSPAFNPQEGRAAFGQFSGSSLTSLLRLMGPGVADPYAMFQCMIRPRRSYTPAGGSLQCSSGCISTKTGQVLSGTTVVTRGVEDLHSGDTIGLLLDLDQGIMSAYINGTSLGRVSPIGWGKLSGPLVWAVDLGHNPGVDRCDGLDAVRVRVGKSLPLEEAASAPTRSDEDDCANYAHCFISSLESKERRRRREAEGLLGSEDESEEDSESQD